MDHVREFLHVEGIIGQGAFGKILATSLRHQEHNRTSFALKCVHPIVKPQRLANELRHLRDLGGQHNVAQMHTAHFNRGTLFIVMDLFEHDRFMDIVANLELEEIVIYMMNLLEALEHVHSLNVMHRDIKPANFLFNRKNKKFLLVDFGLAQVVRARTGNLFGGGRPTNSIGGSSTNSILSAPTTPTSTQTRRTITYSRTPDAQDRRLDNRNRLNNDHLIKPTPIVNINSITHKIIHQSPARHYINMAPANSPNTPNVATKRHISEMENTNCKLLKKLRVSTRDDEIKEPVKLTVGAYESPVTNNDSGSKRMNHNQHNHKFSTPIVPSKQQNYGTRCDCRGKPRTCNTCLARPDSNAPKSGTPGYKAPEVLFRYMNQTTALDIWSAGVIFACLLSGHAPFFRDADDNASLAEIITLLGSHQVIQAAKAIGINLNVQPKREPVDLRQLCRKIRLNNIDKRQIDIPDVAFDLLYCMLDPNPSTRITARDALQHTWFEDCRKSDQNVSLN